MLPFDNLSPDPDQEYFCDGITEELIADLSKIRSLRVISRTSSMMLKGRKKDIRTIARDVNVQYVLEGSVRKAGNNLRITAQLMDAPSDAHRWSEKYSGTTEDVFDIQEKVSRSIVDALKLELSLEEQRQMAERPIVNAEAYEWYIRGSGALFRYTEDSMNESLRCYQQALAWSRAPLTGESAMVVRRIAPLSLGKVAFVLYAAIGFIVGLIVALIGLMGIALGDLGSAAPFVGLALGAGAIIASPIFYGVMGFLVGVMSAAIYNLAAGIIGGVEVDLQ